MTSFVAPVLQEDEEDVELTLRPRRLDEFVGQERVKEQLAISLEAAKARDEALDHVLLVGPPGLGKTSLAYIVREELGVGIRCIAGPALVTQTMLQRAASRKLTTCDFRRKMPMSRASIATMKR